MQGVYAAEKCMLRGCRCKQQAASSAMVQGNRACMQCDRLLWAVAALRQKPARPHSWPQVAHVLTASAELHLSEHKMQGHERTASTLAFVTEHHALCLF